MQFSVFNNIYAQTEVKNQGSCDGNYYATTGLHVDEQFNESLYLYANSSERGAGVHVTWASIYVWAQTYSDVDVQLLYVEDSSEFISGIIPHYDNSDFSVLRYSWDVIYSDGGCEVYSIDYYF